MKRTASPQYGNVICMLIATAFLAPACNIEAAPITYADAVTSNTPYAYYRLGETSGTVAADSSGNNRNGAYIQSPTLGVAGAGVNSDYAVDLNGTSQYVNTGLTSFGSQLSVFSVEMVIKIDTTAQTSLFGAMNTGSTTALTFQTNSTSSGTYAANSSRLFLRSEDGTSAGFAFTSTDLYSGDYVHLVLTFNAASGFIAYLNGQQISSTSSTTLNGKSFANFTFSPYVGANDARGTATGYDSGTYDEVAFYNYRLNATQVADHYAALVAVPEPSSVSLAAVGLIALVTTSLRRRPFRP
ncbi:MAG: hypothetical protein J0I10_11115 [Verrucomicrobia bacterium]|mgnify:CR=1 FL=1|nr:hypothetical protein [Verrucomicrobiota bacterium]